MFTGIVQCIARIASVTDHAGIRSIEIEFPDEFTDGLAVGGSISVDGVCLTATNIRSQRRASFDVVLQTLAVTTLWSVAVGKLVNVERAAKEGAEIGGHPLSGHIDFSSAIIHVSEAGANKALRIHVPEHFRRYVFAKGYIAVDGASLTISEASKHDGWFEVWLIPETRRVTTLDLKSVGDLVNVEIDRGTQVIVDTVHDTIADALERLAPGLQTFVAERGEHLEELLARPLLLTSAMNFVADPADKG